MRDHLKSDYIIEEKIQIGEIPAILFRPRVEKKAYPTLILYYGWGTIKESQRLRGILLSSLGYQVVTPEYIHHGERGPLSDYDGKGAAKYFWSVILNNIEESTKIIDGLISKHKADPDRIGILGESLGGISSAGIFTHNPIIKALVVFNGSCAWERDNKLIIRSFQASEDQVDNESVRSLRKKLREKNPMNNLQLLKDRPILTLHGDSDTLVPVERQRAFYKAIEPLYTDKDRLKHVEYPDVDHVLTSAMMEEAIAWFYKYL